MKIFKTIILVLLIAMSLGAGAAKIFQIPQEVEFFTQAGLSVTFMMALGALQIAGGGFSAFQKFRKPGAAVMGIGFLVSTIVIFINGNIGFGVISLVPAALAGFLAFGGPRP